MSEDVVEEGILSLETMTGAEVLAVVQGMFDNAPAGMDPYMDLDFEDAHGFLRTVRIYPVNESDEALH